MVRTPVDAERGVAAVRSWADRRARPEEGAAVTREQLRLAVRYTLELLTARAPGHSVEVRIPPLAAVQAIPGPRHRRGTPAAVVEISPDAWLALSIGELTWHDALTQGLVRASGARADLSAWLPLIRS